ncbi:MAG: MFS transporter, partial [Chloroflexota bacterium]
DAAPTAALRRNGAFVRLWGATTVSVFGSFVTRIALPFVAILTLGAGPFDVAILRSLELVAALLVGFVAGAWVDRLRRRPVMVWADIGRAVLLATIPLGYLGGWLSLVQVFAVAAAAAVLTTFFDVADRAYLPSIVPRGELVRANATLTASISAMEFIGFGAAGFLVSLLTAPIAIAIDAVSFVFSALFLGSIRQAEPPPPPPEDREPVLHEIREGLRTVRDDRVILGIVGGGMGLAAMWGIFGATWMLFVVEDLHIGAEVVGVIAALGGFGSLFGALLAERVTNRWGFGQVLVVSSVVVAFGNLLIPLAPAALPVVAIGCLVGQQLIGDTAMTVFDVSMTSVMQGRVDDRRLGRVNATLRVGGALAQLTATLAGGLIAQAIGLREAAFLAPAAALLATVVLLLSPARSLGRDVTRGADAEPEAA